MQINTTLYYQNTKNTVRQWKVFVVDNKITVEFGQVDGKLQTKDTFVFGKNIGKINETTDHEQAILEAKAKWEKQVKKGYTENILASSSVKLPQKVKTYLGNEDKIIFPAYSTYKYNGVNATYWLQADGSLKLTSRGGDEYPAIPHLENSIRFVLSALDTTSINGELYIHGQHLQDITSAVKKPKELSKQLAFRFFEFPEYVVPENYKKSAFPGNAFIYKVRWLHILKHRHLADTGADPYATAYDNDMFVKPVELQLVANKIELEAHYNKAVSEGYEGTVIYNQRAEYCFNQRSSDVYKYKKCISKEFLIKDWFTDKNMQPVFWCAAENKMFKVKPKGTTEQREQIRENAANWVGKWMTVEFETYSKDKVPLKPVGIGLRNGTINNEGTFIPSE